MEDVDGGDGGGLGASDSDGPAWREENKRWMLRGMHHNTGVRRPGSSK